MPCVQRVHGRVYLFARDTGDGLGGAEYSGKVVVLHRGAQTSGEDKPRYVMNTVFPMLRADFLAVIGSAAELVRKELETLSVRIPVQPVPRSEPQVDPQFAPQSFLPLLPLPTNIIATSNVSNAHPSGVLPQQAPIFFDASYFNNQLSNDMDYNLLDMSPEMFDVFSQIEPISATMNPGFDLF